MQVTTSFSSRLWGWFWGSGTKMKPTWRSFLIRWLGISLILHLAAGFWSLGFYDVDEHFQVLEFLNAHLGRTPLSELAWEYHQRTRSWIQPYLYEGLARVWLFIGVENPFTWATSFRLLSSILGWTATVGMALVSVRWFEKSWQREWVVRLLCLLWFVPYLHARTSAENLGGTVFFWAVTIYFLRPRKTLDWGAAIAIGALFGLAFHLRYHMSVMIAGFGAWVLLREKQPLSRVFGVLAGLVAMFGLGLVIDRLGFGQWGLTPWRYFNDALLSGRAAAFGVHPWWQYFAYMRDALPPIGLVITAGILLGWAFKPLHPLTWMTAPFVLIHFLIGHKEPRVLYPITLAVPALCVLGFSALGDRLPQAATAWRWLRGPLLFVNGAGLLVASVKPSTVYPRYYEYIWKHRDEIKSLEYLVADPYNLGGVPVYFYRPAGLELRPLASFDAARARVRAVGENGLWLHYTHFELPDPELQSWCELRYTVFPDWLKSFYFLEGIRKSAAKWSVFRCRSTAAGG